MNTASDFTVLSPKEFIADVALEAKHAKKRVWAQAMDVEPGETADTFFHIFKDAAKRGLDTRFHADYYSLLVNDGVFNYWPIVSRAFKKKRERKITKKKQLAAEFTDAGVKLLYTNPPTLLDKVFPVRGRNHMKIVIVENAAWIGGVNFSEENFAARDIMVKITDEKIVSEIVYVYGQIDASQQLRDMAIDCTDESKLLVDGGEINRSLILRHSVELVNTAKTRVQLISPLIPDADLLFALKSAIRRGVSVEVLAPESIRMSGIYVFLDEFNGFMMRLRGGGLPIHFKPQMIHAKILIVDEREVIVGSHNFSSRGVRMGTEEIALRSTNKTLVKNLLEFYESLRTSE